MKKILLSLFLLLCITSLLHAADNVFTDNIGIGKTSPSARLDIRSVGTTTGLAVRFADSLASDKAAVLDNGNVGIGTITPSEQVTVAGGNLLQTFTAQPKVIGTITHATKLNNPYSVYVSGKYAYVGVNAGNRLTIVDIANPASPSIVGSLTDTDNLYNPYSVYVSGQYAYVADYYNYKMTIVDVSNPGSPTVTGSVYDATNLNSPYSVYVSGKYAYVAGFYGSTLAVIDVANPNSPFVASSLYDATRLAGPDSVYVCGKYAYVTDYTNDRLTVVDVSIPTSPVIASSLLDTTNIHDPSAVYVSGRYAYVPNYNGNRFTVVDVSNPLSPKVAGTVTDATYLNVPNSVYVCGKYAYVACYNGNSLTVVDVSNPASPFVATGLIDSTNFYYATSVFVSGKYAYVTPSWGTRLTVVDISGIDAPAATIGAIATGTLQVTENANVGNLLSVGGGLNVGQGGILSGPVAINPSFQDSAGTSSVAVLEIRRPGTSPASPILFVSSSGVGIGMTRPGYQLQLSLDSAGKPTSGTWTNPSDIRLKKNIHTIAGGLDTLLALHGVEFEWKDPAQFANFSTPHMGFIAQEVEQVVPYWIGTDRQGYKTITIGGFEALAVEALRQLKKENEELKAKTAEYERQIEKLEKG
jgi:hypothetical protein